MTEQWQELKETIIELRDNNGTGTQQDVCKFLANYMDILEKQITDEEDVLDKIRAEIEQTVSRYTISRERDAMGQVEWSDRLIKESEVLQIIDKYKTESED